MDLNQITLPALNVDESVAFYQMLGFQQIVASEGYARFLSQAGDSTFSLHRVNKVYAEAELIIYFEVDDLDATVVALEAKGIKFESPPKMQDWLWYEAYLRDPAGNRICLYHAGENRKHPPWRLA